MLRNELSVSVIQGGGGSRESRGEVFLTKQMLPGGSGRTRMFQVQESAHATVLVLPRNSVKLSMREAAFRNEIFIVDRS